MKQSKYIIVFYDHSHFIIKIKLIKLCNMLNNCYRGRNLVKKYEKQHIVEVYECDVNKMMTITSILKLINVLAEDQSELLGCGNDLVKKFGLTWIVTSYILNIKRLPNLKENILLVTKNMEYNKFFCYRDFAIIDSRGTEIITINATLVLMDFINRKIKSIPEELISPFESKKIKKIKNQEKIENIDNKNQNNISRYNVRFQDIDGNQHVNNTVYFNWIIDVLDYDFLITYMPQKIIIRFDKEISYRNEIESHYEKVTIKNIIKTKHEIKINNQLYCTANIVWVNKELEEKSRPNL